MNKSEKKSEHRFAFYAIATAICSVLIVAGFVIKPEVKLTVKDLEADLAIYMNLNDIECSLSIIDEILSRDSENLYAILMRAYIHLSDKEAIEAALLYKKALALSGNYPEIKDDILDSIISSSLASENYSDAKWYSEKKLEEYGENNLNRLIIALSSFCLGDDKGYEENLDKVLNMDLTNPTICIKIDQIIKDGEIRRKLYLRTLIDRAKYEQKWFETTWMHR